MTPREALLKRLHRAWEAFHESYAGLSDPDLLKAGVTGTWSVKDIIAHVTWWEEEALTHLPVILAGGRPPRYSVTYGGIDAFNARMTELRKDLSLSEVLRQRDLVHGRLVALPKPRPSPRSPAKRAFAAGCGSTPTVITRSTRGRYAPGVSGVLPDPPSD